VIDTLFFFVCEFYSWIFGRASVFPITMAILETNYSQGSAAVPRDQRQNYHASSDANNSAHDQETAHTGGMILNHVDEAALAAAYQEEITPNALRPREKEKNTKDLDSPAVEESTEARLERLGRQRPDVFDSIWSEIGFVFSISMAQILSVRILSSHAVESY